MRICLGPLSDVFNMADSILKFLDPMGDHYVRFDVVMFGGKYFVVRLSEIKFQNIADSMWRLKYGGFKMSDVYYTHPPCVRMTSQLYAFIYICSGLEVKS
jgi:hypothetical protein